MNIHHHLCPVATVVPSTISYLYCCLCFVLMEHIHLWYNRQIALPEAEAVAAAVLVVMVVVVVVVVVVAAANSNTYSCTE